MSARDGRTVQDGNIGTFEGKNAEDAAGYASVYVVCAGNLVGKSGHSFGHTGRSSVLLISRYLQRKDSQVEERKLAWTASVLVHEATC